MTTGDFCGNTLRAANRRRNTREAIRLGLPAPGPPPGDEPEPEPPPKPARIPSGPRGTYPVRNRDFIGNVLRHRRPIF